MKEKVKKIIFGYLPGFVLGVITAISISVIAVTYFPSGDVTYDNTESGLKSTDVQGAIDELYGVCTTKPPGEQIIEDGGLEKDPYECRYFFIGANPNNYITFNGETAGWRIISVECDGTIKIMRNESIGGMAWDTSSNNNWSRPATLSTYLNETYLNNLNNEAQSQIVPHNFSIGSLRIDEGNLENTINNENGTTWSGKIALPTASEYIRSNSNKTNCGAMNQVWSPSSTSCGVTTWMHNNTYWWTLSPSSYNSTQVFIVVSTGGLYDYYRADNFSNSVRPTLYLSSEVKLSGSGTSSDPYTIN